MAVKRLLSKTGSVDLFIKRAYIWATVLIYKLRYFLIQVKPKQIIFESFQGKSASDSPYALYLQLQKSLPNAKFIWVFANDNIEGFHTLQNRPNTHCVIRGTTAYFQAYASSQYWIVNCRLPYRLLSNSKQTVIQCWHGTPLKKLGMDIKVENHPTSSLKAMHFAYQWEGRRCDYFLSPSAYASNCFVSSFGLDKNQIVELGYPRNDSLFRYKDDIEYQQAIKQKLGIKKDKKVILYAPTFRDDDFSNGKHIATNRLDNDAFKTQFEDVQFLFRGHYFANVESKKDTAFLDVSDYPLINDLLLIADEIITDYSSLFFDYLILERPMYFYMYDKNKYLNDIRGAYLNVDTDMPGPIIENQKDLLHAMKNIKATKEQLDKFNKLYNPNEDGQSSFRIHDTIIK